MAEPRGTCRLHRIYGWNLRSSFPFENRLGEAKGAADRSFELADGPLELPGQPVEKVYSSVVTDVDGRSVFDLRRQDERELLRFVGRVEYAIEGDSILCRALGLAGRDELEALLLSSVLAYCLEREGVLALHAAAIEIEGRAVAFLARSGGGKSTLALSFLAAGRRLLTDDVLPIELVGGRIVARPGYPQIRLSDDVSRHLFGRRVEEWPRLLPDRSKRGVPADADGLGGFCARGLPLAAIYLLERNEGATSPRLRRLSARDAMVELLRHSFAPRLVEGVGLQAERFGRLSALAAEVPVGVISYASGMGRLDEVRRTVISA